MKRIILELIEEEVLTEKAFDDFGNIEGYNILHCLCGHWCDYGALDYIKVYSNEILVNEKDSTGRNPLHYLCIGDGLGPLCYEEREIIQYLFSKNITINEKDDMGRTPLWYACDYIREYIGDTEEYVDEIAETLIELGANVNYGDDDGMTPLHLSVAHDDYGLTKRLLKNGADPHYKTTNGTYLTIATHSEMDIPIGSKPIDLTKSERIKKIFLR